MENCFFDEIFFNGTKDGAILTKIAFLMIAVVIFTFDHSWDILKDPIRSNTLEQLECQ